MGGGSDGGSIGGTVGCSGGSSWGGGSDGGSIGGMIGGAGGSSGGGGCDGGSIGGMIGGPGGSSSGGVGGGLAGGFGTWAWTCGFMASSDGGFTRSFSHSTTVCNQRFRLSRETGRKAQGACGDMTLFKNDRSR